MECKVWGPDCEIVESVDASDRANANAVAVWKVVY